MRIWLCLVFSSFSCFGVFFFFFSSRRRHTRCLSDWSSDVCSSDLAHYLVKAWDGGIIQFVAESDTAYHARSADPYTIGIEHEFDWRYGIWHTEAQYRDRKSVV